VANRSGFADLLINNRALYKISICSENFIENPQINKMDKLTALNIDQTQG